PQPTRRGPGAQAVLPARIHLRGDDLAAGAGRAGRERGVGRVGRGGAHHREPPADHSRRARGRWRAMKANARLRSLLAALVKEKRDGVPRPEHPRPEPVARGDAIGVEAFRRGGEGRGGRGWVLGRGRRRRAVGGGRPPWGPLEVAPGVHDQLRLLFEAGLERALFLDLETTGFVGAPVFLAGTMRWNGE